MASRAGSGIFNRFENESPDRVPTLVVLVFGYLLSQFYRSFLAVIAPELAADVHLGPAELGMVSAAFFAAFALVQLPIGASLDRFGAGRTVADRKSTRLNSSHNSESRMPSSA
jgi:MFS family permease